jgi:hypothetical protein
MRRLLYVLAALSVACSGSSDNGVAPKNTPPTITFTFTKLGVVRNAPVILSVAVNDADGDPLKVTWSITRGTLTSQNAANTQMSWAVPATVGLDTVVVSVSDGKTTAKITEPIKVGWPATGAQATFIKSRSPYIVTLDAANPVLPVDAGSVTSIEAGVEILLENEQTVIDVSGRLVSNGTGAEPVIIRPNVRGQQCGDDRGWWIGIRGFTSAGPPSDGEIELHHTEVWYGQKGVWLLNAATASLHGCAIRCSGEAGVQHDGSGVLRVIDSEVSNGAVDGIVLGSNVSTALPDSVIIQGCEIKFNARDGMLLSIDDQPLVSTIIVESSRIENNLRRGITLTRASSPVMHFNSFSGNGVGSGVTNIYLENGFPNGAAVPEISATCNYFGVNSQSTIDATIHDTLDAPVLIGTRVVTDPWVYPFNAPCTP